MTIQSVTFKILKKAKVTRMAAGQAKSGKHLKKAVMTLSLDSLLPMSKSLKVRKSLSPCSNLIQGLFPATCFTQGTVYKPNISWHCDIDARLAKWTCDPPPGNYTVNQEDLFNVTCKADAGFPAIESFFSFPPGLQNESHSRNEEQNEDDGMYSVEESISLIQTENYSYISVRFLSLQRFWDDQILYFNIKQNRTTDDDNNNPDDGDNGSESMHSLFTSLIIVCSLSSILFLTFF